MLDRQTLERGANQGFLAEHFKILTRSTNFVECQGFRFPVPFGHEFVKYLVGTEIEFTRLFPKTLKSKTNKMTRHFLFTIDV